MLYVDTRGPGGGLGAVLADLRASDRRIRLVTRADSTKLIAKLATILHRIVTISIPPTSEREDDLERLLEAYGSDAAAELGASWLGFRPGDPERVLTGGIATLDEIEGVARRLVALRDWGVTEGRNDSGSRTARCHAGHVDGRSRCDPGSTSTGNKRDRRGEG
jgi:hypothetical protein